MKSTTSTDPDTPCVIIKRERNCSPENPASTDQYAVKQINFSDILTSFLAEKKDKPVSKHGESSKENENLALKKKKLEADVITKIDASIKETKNQKNMGLFLDNTPAAYLSRTPTFDENFIQNLFENNESYKKLSPSRSTLNSSLHSFKQNLLKSLEEETSHSDTSQFVPGFKPADVIESCQSNVSSISIASRSGRGSNICNDLPVYKNYFESDEFMQVLGKVEQCLSMLHHSSTNIKRHESSKKNAWLKMSSGLHPSSSQISAISDYTGYSESFYTTGMKEIPELNEIGTDVSGESLSFETVFSQGKEDETSDEDFDLFSKISESQPAINSELQISNKFEIKDTPKEVKLVNIEPTVHHMGDFSDQSEFTWNFSAVPNFYDILSSGKDMDYAKGIPFEIRKMKTLNSLTSKVTLSSEKRSSIGSCSTKKMVEQGIQTADCNVRFENVDVNQSTQTSQINFGTTPYSTKSQVEKDCKKRVAVSEQTTQTVDTDLKTVNQATSVNILDTKNSTLWNHENSESLKQKVPCNSKITQTDSKNKILAICNKTSKSIGVSYKSAVTSRTPRKGYSPFLKEIYINEDFSSKAFCGLKWNLQNFPSKLRVYTFAEVNILIRNFVEQLTSTYDREYFANHTKDMELAKKLYSDLASEVVEHSRIIAQNVSMSCKTKLLVLQSYVWKISEYITSVLFGNVGVFKGPKRESSIIVYDNGSYHMSTTTFSTNVDIDEPSGLTGKIPSDTLDTIKKTCLFFIATRVLSIVAASK